MYKQKQVLVGTVTSIFGESGKLLIFRMREWRNAHQCWRGADHLNSPRVKKKKTLFFHSGCWFSQCLLMKKVLASFGVERKMNRRSIKQLFHFEWATTTVYFLCKWIASTGIVGFQLTKDWSAIQQFRKTKMCSDSFLLDYIEVVWQVVFLNRKWTFLNLMSGRPI